MFVSSNPPPLFSALFLRYVLDLEQNQLWRLIAGPDLVKIRYVYHCRHATKLNVYILWVDIRFGYLCRHATIFWPRPSVKFARMS